MISWFLKRQIRAFERTFDYDASYARDILDASPQALFLFSWLSKIVGYRKDVPADAWFAANITAALAEDCGPCTQLAVTMAERSGVSPEAIRAVLSADEKAMPPEVALGFRFARAVLARDIDESDRLRAEILKRWGPRGLVSLAFTISASRVYPSVKYALGRGRACTQVRVAGADAPLAHRASHP